MERGLQKILRDPTLPSDPAMTTYVAGQLEFIADQPQVEQQMW
jgi:hypothetical protein